MLGAAAQRRPPWAEPSHHVYETQNKHEQTGNGTKHEKNHPLHHDTCFRINIEQILSPFFCSKMYIAC